jgi:uncharacterized pyridoxal phosphate-containing UPF0001 family protein
LANGQKPLRKRESEVQFDLWAANRSILKKLCPRNRNIWRLHRLSPEEWYCTGENMGRLDGLERSSVAISIGSIRENYERVLNRIGEAALSMGRDPGAVRLVLVTKGHPVEVVRMALEAGAGHLGENYVEEAIGKIEAVGKPVGVEWHMIGHVQGRKARLVCRYFHWIHSLDSSKLARRFCSGMEVEGLYPGKRQPVLLECNVSGEESKFGFPAWREDSWPGLLAEFHEIACLPQLEVRGLMTMAPFLPDQMQRAILPTPAVCKNISNAKSLIRTGVSYLWG